MLIEQHNGVAGLNLFQDKFALGLFLLILRQTLGILEFGDGYQFERHVVAYAVAIVVDARLEVLVGGLANQYQESFHN
jgi:hypothetical protein